MITVTGRRLTMSGDDRFIGFEGDHNAKTLEFMISDSSISELHFKIDIENPPCTVTPQKIMQADGGAVLTWTIGNGIMQNSGGIKIQLRGFDDDGNIVWHSESAELYIGKSIDSQTEYTDEELSDFERIEQSVTVMLEGTAENASQAHESALNAQSYADSAQESCAQAQGWANAAQNGVESAVSIANSAKSTADSASNTANTAKSAADSANSNSSNALDAANGALYAANSAIAVANQAQSDVQSLEEAVEEKAQAGHIHALAKSASSSDLASYDVMFFETSDTDESITHAQKGEDGFYSFIWYSWYTNLFKAGDTVSLTFESLGGSFSCADADIYFNDYDQSAVVEDLVLTAPLYISGSFGGVKIRVDKHISGADGFMSACDKAKLERLKEEYELTDNQKQEIADIVADTVMNPLEAIIDESGVLS